MFGRKKKWEEKEKLRKEKTEELVTAYEASNQS